MKLSQRERVLLFILALVAVTAVFTMLVIKPLDSAIKRNNEEIAAYSDKAMQMRAVISAEDDIRSAHEETSLRYSDAAMFFPGITKSYRIHTFLSAICSMCRVEAVSMQIGAYTPLNGVNGEALTSGDAGMYVVSVSMELSGSKAALLNAEDMLDRSNAYMRVSAFTFTGISAQDTDILNASVLVDIYAYTQSTKES